MKSSVYNLRIPNFPSRGESLIYNTRTQAMGVFDNPLSVLLTQPGERLSLEEDQFTQLLEDGFCVPDHMNEMLILEKWFKELCYDKKQLTLTVLTTFKCNFDCLYCFEKNSTIPSRDMSLNTAQNLCQWIQREVKKNNSQSIHLFFYGGEPLINKDSIYAIAENIKDFSEKEKITFKFGIVTNGFLIRKEDTAEFKKLGLDFFRITLDGTAQWHDITRPLKGGGPTFNRILDNIIHQTEKVKILISGNITNYNFSGIVELIKYLGQHPIRERIHSMTFGNVMDNHQNCTRKHPCYAPSEENFHQNYLIIKDTMKKYNFKDSKNQFGMQKCPFKLEKSFLTITPEGSIYKCPLSLGRNEFCVGNIYDEDFNHFNQKVLDNDQWKKCYPCTYLPLCQGGCYYDAYLKNKDLFSRVCPKKIFETLLPESLKDEYEKLS